MKRLEATARIVVVHGVDDKTCPYEDAVEMVGRMQHAKLAVEPRWVTTDFGKDEPVGIRGDKDLKYALELAEQGFVTLSPDYPSFGEHAYDFTADTGYSSGSIVHGLYGCARRRFRRCRRSRSHAVCRGGLSLILCRS